MIHKEEQILGHSSRKVWSRLSSLRQTSSSRWGWGASRLLYDLERLGP